jgi:hypothetical protein
MKLLTWINNYKYCSMEVALQKKKILRWTATLKFLQTLNSCLCKQMKVAASCRRTAYLLPIAEVQLASCCLCPAACQLNKVVTAVVSLTANKWRPQQTGTNQGNGTNDQSWNSTTRCWISEKLSLAVAGETEQRRAAASTLQIKIQTYEI